METVTSSNDPTPPDIELSQLQPRRTQDTPRKLTHKNLTTYLIKTGTCKGRKQALQDGQASRTIRPVSQSEEGDPENPRNWSTREKCALGIFVLYTGFVATLGTPIYISAVPSVMVLFDVNETEAIIPDSLYAYGLAIGALLGTAGCEIFGRRIIYRISIPLSLAFTIVGGFSQSHAVLGNARLFAGLFSGPSLTVGVGILNDIWDLSLEKIGTMFAVLFVVMLVWSAEAGPMISASILTERSWRWTFWVPAMLIGGAVLMMLFLPETYEPQILRARMRKEGLPMTKRGNLLAVFMVAAGRPLHMIIVEPIIFPTGLVLAITQSVIFSSYVTYSYLFTHVYAYTSWQVGMAFGPLVIGSLLAIPITAFFDRVTYQPARAAALLSGSVVAPEKRLYPAMIGSILLPISLFWLAWSGREGVPAIVPLISGGLFGMAYVLNMLCLPIYNNDVYTTHYGASVLASSTFLRFIVAASFPLFTTPMINKVGFAWAASVLGFVSVGLVPVPWVFWKWGPWLRGKSRYLRVQEDGSTVTEGGLENRRESGVDGGEKQLESGVRVESERKSLRENGNEAEKNSEKQLESGFQINGEGESVVEGSREKAYESGVENQLEKECECGFDNRVAGRSKTEMGGCP